MLYEMFEKIQTILLYLFAARQPTSTLRWQKFNLLYVKFSAEFNELSFRSIDIEVIETVFIFL